MQKGLSASGLQLDSVVKDYLTTASDAEDNDRGYDFMPMIRADIEQRRLFTVAKFVGSFTKDHL